MVKINNKFIFRRILPVLAGGLLGYAYYYFIGCNSGGCAISSNPYISTIYGSVLGFFISMPSNKRDLKNNEDEDKNNKGSWNWRSS